MPLDDSGMAQDESGGYGCRVLGLPEQRLTSGLPKPITAPCGSLTQLAARSGPLPGHSLGSSSAPAGAASAATWVSLMTPQRNAAEV
jgi:hypothetical protein